MKKILRYGFSLIESAMILVISGLVIGAAWIAAAAVTESLKINKASLGVIAIINNLRPLIPASMATGSWQSIGALAINSGAVPKDFLVNGSLKSPWDNPIAIGIDGDSSTGYIQVGMSVPNKSICLKLSSQITQRFKDNSDLVSLEIGNGAQGWIKYTAWPLTPSSGQCNGYTPPIELAFQFSFAR